MDEPDRWVRSAGPARRRAAAAVRELGERLVHHEFAENELAALAENVEAAIKLLPPGTDRLGPIDDLKKTAYDDPVGDGQRTHHNPDCIVCGPGNPAGLGAVVHRQGDEVVAHLAVGAVMRGAPGRAHGGVLALALDDLMGHVLVVLGQPAYTVQLEVEYLAPAPVGTALEIRVATVHREGRRLTLAGTVSDGDTVVTRAEGLFITVDEL